MRSRRFIPAVLTFLLLFASIFFAPRLEGAVNSHTLTASMDSSGVDTLELAGFPGAIEVEGTDGSEVQVEVLLTSLSDKDGLMLKLAAFKLGKAVSDGRALIKLVPFPGTPPSDYEARTRVLVPAGIGLEYEMDEGQISIVGLQSPRARIRLNDGRIEVSRSAIDECSLFNRNGKITVERSVGSLFLATESGDILVRSHDGFVAANTYSGSVLIQGGLGARNVISDRGNVEVILGEMRLLSQKLSSVYDAVQINTFDADVNVKVPAGECRIEVVRAADVQHPTLGSGDSSFGSRLVRIVTETGEVVVEEFSRSS